MMYFLLLLILLKLETDMSYLPRGSPYTQNADRSYHICVIISIIKVKFVHFLLAQKALIQYTITVYRHVGKYDKIRNCYSLL